MLLFLRNLAKQAASSSNAAPPTAVKNDFVYRPKTRRLRAKKQTA